MSTEKRVIFVCSGNICRSPMAEALLASRSSAQELSLAPGSSGTLGGRIERRCRLTLALRLTSGGELRWQTEAKSEIADFVPKSRIEVLQSSSYDFADTELEEKNWGKFVEPIIVSAVLGSLIYIFFTNR